MQFPARDFTNQYISTSYQDVLQKYNPSDIFYILDGVGNVICAIPSASVGQVLITSDLTASMTVASASYAITYSYTNIISSSYASSSFSASYSITSSHSETSDNADFALAAYYSTTTDTAVSSSYSLTSSYALNGGSGGTTLTTGSTCPITSSWAVSASWAPGSETSNTSSYSYTSSYSQFALTASYVNIIPSGSTESASYSITSSYSILAQRVVDSGLSIPPYDYSNIIYNGPQGQFGSCTYRNGGISGSIVTVVTGIYSGNLFIGVSKSLS